MEATSPSRVNILLVDDHPADAAALETVLAAQGHDLVTVPSGAGTLREILRREFGLIVIDARTRGVPAADVAAQIRRHPRARGIPILFVNEGKEPVPLPEVAGQGPVDHVARPLHADRLRAKVALLIDLHLKGKRLKAQDRMLRQRERQVMNVTASRDEFLSVASHELRTPLTSLRLEVANLLRLARRSELKADAQLVSRVEKIDAQTARLHRLIDELLDVSRIVSGRLELELEEVDLAEVAREVGSRFRDEAARQGSALGVRAPMAAIGYWDRGRVDQIIANLVSNAIKYGEGKPIDIVVETAHDRAVLMVRDSGVGIPVPDQERIFGRFERAASSRNYGGIGVGLWTVKQIVDALAGTVTVDSQPGMGATFRVALPRARGAATAARLGGSLRPRELIAREMGARARS